MRKSSDIGWIDADWPTPAGIYAGTTTRAGGVSLPPYDSLNLGDHVEDDAEAVRENRDRLRTALALPNEPLWLQQVHGVTVAEVNYDSGTPAHTPEADASIGRQRGDICVVLTADCLPVLFCNQQGTVVAAAHAGWRGLANGVLEETVKRMAVPANEIMAWMGPAIGPAAFEVGDEVRQTFVQQQPAADAAFQPSATGRWLADLYQLARLRLNNMGVAQVFGGQRCTYTEEAHFYSYRRDGVTGRMASLIWIGTAPE